MKKLIASVGLVAVGASGVQAASFSSLTTEGAKPWSVSATLRGFYDDNFNTVPNGSADRHSTFGFEIDPSLSLAWTSEQTTASLSYMYGFRWYDKAPLQFSGNEHYDQNHTFNALLDHTFSERYRVRVQDSFVIGQEPDFLRAGPTFTTFQRVPGNNIRNYGQINFDAQITRLFGLEVGYANQFWHFEDTGAMFDELGNVIPSTAGLLDRIEHSIHIDGRWTMMPDTVGFVGYQYGFSDYTGNEVIGQAVDPNTLDVVQYMSDVRNVRSHYGYVGVEHWFRQDLYGRVQVGPKYYDYYNDPSHTTSLDPAAQASLRWFYVPDSYVDLGVGYDRNASDLFSISGTSITTDAESFTIYGSVNHHILPNLIGSLLGQFQHSSLNGGTFNGIVEKYYLVGLNFEYRFNPHLSANAGYNYDNLDSEAGRSFDRNRVYIGVTATY